MIDLAAVEDATPLGPEELAGLKMASIITQADLNAAEEANILRALTWTRRSRRKDLLTRDYVLALHARMFGDVWQWAGTWRRRQTNLGLSANIIPVRVEGLLADVTYWIEHETYPPEEIAIRLHHQLVFIHPFANGNGRHTRLMADLVAERLGRAAFTWGRGNLAAAGETRRAYIAALRAADGGDIAPLLEFALS